MSPSRGGGRRRQAPRGSRPRSAAARARARLDDLHAIGRLLQSAGGPPWTLDEALRIVQRSLPLRSAFLLEASAGGERTTCWPATGAGADLGAAHAHLRAAYRYLAGPAGEGAAPGPFERREALPASAAEAPGPRPFLVLPLVVDRDLVLGALQLESARPLDRGDLSFAAAVASHLAFALARAAAALRDPLELARARAASFGASALAVDREGRITFLDEAAAHLLGAGPDVLGRPVVAVVRLVDAAGKAVEPPTAQAIRTGASLGSEVHELVPSSGPRFPVRWSARPIRSAGAVVGAVLALEDVKERKRAEAAHLLLLEASKALGASLEPDETLRSLVRHAVPALGDLALVEVPTAAGQLRRVAADHVDATRRAALAALLAAPPRPLGEDAASRAAASGAPELHPVVDVARLAADPAHGAFLHAEEVRSALVVPLRHGGRTLAVLTLAHSRSGRSHGLDDLDLAEELGRRAALALANGALFEASQRAIRTREQVLAVVAHDLRAPLTAILFAAQTLDRGLGPDAAARLRTSVERIERSTSRIRRLVDDLLDFAAIEAGRFSVRPIPHEVQAILEACRQGHEGAAAAAGVALTVEAAPDLPRIACDADRLVQVLGNLVGNALQAVTRGGRIVVSASAEDAQVRFAVADTGPGVRPEDRAHLFERFWRSRRSSHPGTGLGLAICHGIVEAHGGRIWIEGEPGEGATFAFTVPRWTEPA